MLEVYELIVGVAARRALKLINVERYIHIATARLNKIFHWSLKL